MTGYHDSLMVEIHGRTRVSSASLETILFRYLNDVLWREMTQSGCLKRSKPGGEKKHQSKGRKKIQNDVGSLGVPQVTSGQPWKCIYVFIC